MAGINGDAMARFQIGSNAFPQFRDALGWRIAVVPVAKRLYRCFDDMIVDVDGFASTAEAPPRLARVTGS